MNRANSGLWHQSVRPSPAVKRMAGTILRNPGKAILGSAVAYGAAKTLAPTAARAEDGKAAPVTKREPDAMQRAVALGAGSALTGSGLLMAKSVVKGMARTSLLRPTVGAVAQGALLSAAQIGLGAPMLVAGMKGIFGPAFATMRPTSKSEGVTRDERARGLVVGAAFTASGLMTVGSVASGALQRASRRPSVGSLVSGAILGAAQLGVGAPMLAATAVAKAKDGPGGQPQPRAFLDDKAKARAEVNAAATPSSTPGQGPAGQVPAYQDSWADKNGKRYTRHDMSVRTTK